jgi:hypothetical protein
MTEISDAWKLCERLSIVQASLLISGCEPSSFQDCSILQLESNVTHFLAVKTALLSAIEQREDFGKLHHHYSDGVQGAINLYSSYVDVDQLKGFLSEKGMRDGFFFADAAKQADYLDPSHPRYAPKLAAAVGAWEAIDDVSKLGGKSPKKALEKWLRENAADFGLTSEEDGVVNESAIESIARISNWQPQGGAPATPAQGGTAHISMQQDRHLQISPSSSPEPEPSDSIGENPF